MNAETKSNKLFKLLSVRAFTSLALAHRNFLKTFFRGSFLLQLTMEPRRIDILSNCYFAAIPVGSINTFCYINWGNLIATIERRNEPDEKPIESIIRN